MITADRLTFSFYSNAADGAIDCCGRLSLKLSLPASQNLASGANSSRVGRSRKWLRRDDLRGKTTMAEMLIGVYKPLHNQFAHLRACSSVCLGVLLHAWFGGHRRQPVWRDLRERILQLRAD